MSRLIHSSLMSAAGRRNIPGYPTFNWNNVLLAMHFDGADASTTFVDEKGGIVLGVNQTNVAELDTVEKMFGTASLRIPDGTSIYRSGTLSNPIDTSDFTLSLWLKTISSDVDGGVFGFRPYQVAGNEPNGGILGPNILGQTGPIGTAGSVYWGFPNHGRLLVSSTLVNTGDWFHLAYIRAGTTIKLFVNGIKEDEHSNASYSQSVSAHTNRPLFGANDYDPFNTGYIINGWFDDILLVKEALWSDDFTPPTIPFPGA